MKGADILLDEASVTGTENAVMAAVTARGKTSIRNIGQIDRGYERVGEKLRSLEAHIERAVKQ